MNCCLHISRNIHRLPFISRTFTYSNGHLWVKQYLSTSATVLSKHQCGVLRPSFANIGFAKHPVNISTRTGSQVATCSQLGVRLFHTSPRRQIHPLVWMIFKPLAKVASIISGRYFRKWWQKLPAKNRAQFKNALYQSRGKILIALGLLCSAGVANYLLHIQEAPITGRRRYIAFTSDQFMKIAQFEFEMQWNNLKEAIVDPSDPAYKRVLGLSQKIINGNQDLEFMRKQQWTVIVVDNDDANAFILPTGHVFVFTGLLNTVQNDDQLAVVIGHEMAHALLNHAAEQVSVAQAVDLMIIVVMAALWAFLPTDGIALVTQWFYNKVVHLLLTLPYSRQLETEADVVGLQLIAKACYDVRESSRFWQTMAVYGEQSPDDTSHPPEWLSTHPSHENRADKLDAIIPQALETRRECECPELRSPDPRKHSQTLRRILAPDTADPGQPKSTGLPAPPAPVAVAS